MDENNASISETTANLNDLSEPEVLYPEGTLFTTDPDLETKLVELDRFGYPADVMNDPDLADIPEHRRRAIAQNRAEKIAELEADDEERSAYIKERNEEDKLRRAERREALGIKFTRSGVERGFRYERITVIRRDIRDGPLGKYSDGYWLCKCDCGNIVRLSTQELRQKLRKARACPTCLALHYAPRSLRPDKKLGRPRKNLGGMIIGRLTVGEYFDGLGWLCTCAECGGQEVCINQYVVYRRGVIGCDGSCAPQ